jgi:tight adherence protein B
VTALAGAVCTALVVWIVVKRYLSGPEGPVTVAGTAVPSLAGAERRRGRPPFQVWLSQAGAAVTPAQFVAVSAVVGLAAFMVLLAASRTAVTSLAPAAAAAAMPYLYWSAARRKQAAGRSAAWPDAVRYLVGVLGSGIATLHDALGQLAAAGPVPLRAPMARYVRLSARLGDRMALEVLRQELADPISDPVLLAFAGAIEEGTETVLRVLADLSTQITADLQLGEKIRTLQTQSRIANWGCFALPYTLLFFLCCTNPGYRQFFSEPVGVVMVIIGFAVSYAGLMVCRALVKPLPTSARVFASGVAQ